MMTWLVHPSRAERLLAIAANLHCAYSEGSLTESDAFVPLMRRLSERDRRRPLPTVRQMCAGIEPDHAIEHIIVCPVCGQMFDCRDKIQVDHHSEHDHGPKLVS